MRGVFVTGTDTGVGKSVVAGAVCAALARRGEAVAAFKPVVTGLEEETGAWPPDHELLAATTGQPPEEVAPYRFGPAVSPHYAAELAGEQVEPGDLLDAARLAGERADALVCEGVGGLLVPLTPGYLVRDLALDLRLPVVIAARTGLGTINHTLLTVEAAKRAGLSVRAVVMTPWSHEPEPIEASNRATVERLGQVPVSGLPSTDPESLAAAGAELTLDDWL
ncbi:MAG TPA: dethiobiotin synthase [Thermoleophilaceae bacterium]|nr:dethiobiotin synthase [Thermoleophilaceae bacterium]